MTRTGLVSLLFGAVACGTVGCGDVTADAEVASDAATIAFSAVRGYTRPGSANGQRHAIIYRDSIAFVRRHTGTPPGSSQQMGGNLLFGSSPWGYKRSDGVEAVLYVDTIRNIHEITPLSENTFVDANLTMQFAAPIAADGPTGAVPDVIPYVRSDGRNAVIYRSTTNHVIEILSNFGHQPAWLVNDLTAIAGFGVTAAKGSAFPYVRSDGASVIVYIGSDNRVRELFSNFGGSPAWGDGDLSDAVQIFAIPSSSPWGYKRSDGRNAVVFVDTSGTMREYSYKPGEPCAGRLWCAAVLPATSANVNFRPSGFVRSDAVDMVAYISGTNQIRQLVRSNSVWFDFSLPLGANVVALSEPFGHKPDADRASILFRGQNTSTGNIIAYQARLPVGGAWTVSGM